MVVSKFHGREVIKRPTCPFCEMRIDQPKELANRMPLEMPVGKCACGAAYACDVTGHNLGTAMIDALVFGCNGDWDLAWDLLPEEDYIEEQVGNYDLESHLVIPGGAYMGRRIAGTLYFVRLQKDILEVTEGGARQKLERATPVSSHSQTLSAKRREKKSFSKREVEDLVKEHR